MSKASRPSGHDCIFHGIADVWLHAVNCSRNYYFVFQCFALSTVNCLSFYAFSYYTITSKKLEAFQINNFEEIAPGYLLPRPNEVF